MNIPGRILLDPGPSSVPQRILKALGSPTLGHLDPRYIEIGAGLGPFAGKAWRIGLMGHSATQANVDLVLAALKDSLS